MLPTCALLCTVWLVSETAHAQVIRCTDALSGKVTYTDSSCNAGQQTTQVEARKTEQQLAAERAQASEAIEQKQARLKAQAEAEQRQLEREALEARRAGLQQQPQLGAPGDYVKSSECANARRALNAATANLARTPEEQATRIDAAQQQMDFACLGPDGYARAQANRTSQPPVIVVQPPAWPVRPYPDRPHRPERPSQPHIKECTSFTCTDSNGKRYPRTGRGSFQER